MRRKKSLLLPGHVQASRNALRTKHSVSMPAPVAQGFAARHERPDACRRGRAIAQPEGVSARLTAGRKWEPKLTVPAIEASAGEATPAYVPRTGWPAWAVLP